MTKSVSALQDDRQRLYPCVEPLALKIISDWLDAEGKSMSFGRKLRSFYLALVEVTTMNGQGAVLRTSLLEKMSRVNHQDFVELKDVLVSLKLVRVTEEQKPGSGGRKTVFCEILDAPYIGYSTDVEKGHGGKRSPEQRISDPEEGADVESRHLKVVKENSSSDSLRSSSEESGSAVAALSTETQLQQHENPVGDGAIVVEGRSSSDNGSKNVSLRDWRREDIAAWHRDSPVEPPPGATHGQALMCAIATTEGFDTMLATFPKGFSSFAAVCQRLLYDGHGEYKLDYRDWMDGALSFDSIPITPSGEFSFEYWISALRNESSVSRSRRFEQEHYNIKAGKHLEGLSPDEVVTVDEMVAFMQQLESDRKVPTV